MLLRTARQRRATNELSRSGVSVINEGASLAYDVSERQAFLGGPSLSDMPVGGEMVDYAL